MSEPSAIELRLGRWQDALAGVECDVLICDPPYSERTHAGMCLGTFENPHNGRNPYTRSGVTFAHWTVDDAIAFIEAWSPRVRGWIAIVTDDVLAPVIQAAAERCGRYAFAAVPFVEPGKQPRLSGDGPASWTCWIMVSRPSHRPYSAWGSLPGAYVPARGMYYGKREIKGGKPLWLMQALVRDYSRPGDLICDPCAGGATTLIAAAIEGRRAIGAEMDPATHALACKRIARGYTPSMFTAGSTRAHSATAPATQQTLYAAETIKETC